VDDAAAVPPARRRPDREQEQGNQQPARHDQRPDQLVAARPRLRRPEEEHADEPAGERDDHAAEREQDDRRDLAPGRALAPDAEALARDCGDDGRMADAFEDLEDVRVGLRRELLSGRGDAACDLLHHLMTALPGQRVQLVPELSEIPTDDVVGVRGHATRSYP
jgi:hypothetical protein